VEKGEILTGAIFLLYLCFVHKILFKSMLSGTNLRRNIFITNEEKNFLIAVKI
jgi:hypothetical protein